MQPTRFRTLLAFSPIGILAASSAGAQPASLSKQAPATSGSTEVAQEGFKTVERPAAESKDASQLKLMAGALWTAGNSRTLALTGSGDYRLRRADSQFTALAAANYGRSASNADSPYETTVENYQARARYDHFFTKEVAGFASVSARRDRFQRLNLRLNLDPGVAYYFLDEPKHLLWAELGYDLQHDIRRRVLVSPAPGEPAVADVEKTETSHNVRAFAGYKNQLSAAVDFSTSLEYIQGLKDTASWRLSWDGALTSQIDQDFALATTVSIKYDHNPLPDVEKTDVVTALNLVYTLE